MRSRNTLILFAKAPHVCRVKTRLWPDLSHRQCLYFHKKATHKLIQGLYANKNYRLVVYQTNSNSNLNLPRGICTKLQSGLDLGVRMHNAITEELKTSDRVLLIGSDCLPMNITYIESAFSKLNSSRDIVLGPANDGGYVMIGMMKAYHNLFKNIEWGKSSVFESTVSKAQSLGVNIHLMESLIDVDDLQDLQALQNNKQLPSWVLPLLPTN